MAWVVLLDIVVGVLGLAALGWFAWRLVIRPALRLSTAVADVGTRLTEAVERVGTDLSEAVSELGTRVTEALELVSAGSDTLPTHPEDP